MIADFAKPYPVRGPSMPSPDAREGGDYALLRDGQIVAETFFRSSPTHTHDAKALAFQFSAVDQLLDAVKSFIALDPSFSRASDAHLDELAQTGDPVAIAVLKSRIAIARYEGKSQ